MVEPDAWEETTSYAPAVPLTVLVDDEVAAELDFAFKKWWNGRVAVIKDDDMAAGDPVFGRATAALSNAESSIGIRYFDRDLTFSTDGVAQAILHVKESCEP